MNIQTTITAAARDLFNRSVVKMQAEKADMLAALRAGVNDKVLALETHFCTTIRVVDGKPQTVHAHKATAFTATNAPKLQNGVGQQYVLVCRAFAISKGIESVDAALAYMNDALALPTEG